MDQDGITRAARMLSDAQRMVALTGAGISRPSGIPDFRSAGGLWEQDDPIEVASLQTFYTNPQRFYNWVRPLLHLSLTVKPNPAHLALAELERIGHLQAIITQNIDSLHQRAGSHTVYELHGHMRSATCIRCARNVRAETLNDTVLAGNVPYCDCAAQGVFKPDIVLFDEQLPGEPFERARQALVGCDLLLIIGTSLEVYPVAGLPHIALQTGARVIIVNMTETYLDAHADLIIREDVALALPAILDNAAFHYYE